MRVVYPRDDRVARWPHKGDVGDEAATAVLQALVNTEKTVELATTAFWNGGVDGASITPPPLLLHVVSVCSSPPITMLTNFTINYAACIATIGCIHPGNSAACVTSASCSRW
eukprot:SAG25_NODE_123_length_14620_cov_73.222161_8_plen_112_part_00